MTQQVAFRFDNELIEAVDAYAAELAKARPGALEVTRAEAVRELIRLGLERAGERSKRK